MCLWSGGRTFAWSTGEGEVGGLVGCVEVGWLAERV